LLLLGLGISEEESRAKDLGELGLLIMGIELWRVEEISSYWFWRGVKSRLVKL
jgi:hypothetical protein